MSAESPIQSATHSGWQAEIKQEDPARCACAMDSAGSSGEAARDCESSQIPKPKLFFNTHTSLSPVHTEMLLLFWILGSFGRVANLITRHTIYILYKYFQKYIERLT